MRQLYPDPAAQVDVAGLYGRLPPAADGRPAVRVNMIASADGAASLGGLSGGLGGQADKVVFSVLRSLADVIVVGSGTWKAEGYGPARLDQAEQARRRREGQHPVPPIAVLTSTCRLDWDRPFFTAAIERPFVLTASRSDPAERARASQVADVVIAGEETVEMPRVLSELAALGFANVLAEGGPRIAGELAAAGFIDELCLTLSPVLTGGPAGRILAGPVLDPAQPLELAHVLEADGFVFLRYRRREDGERRVGRYAPPE